jgi:hypothetical protein
MTVEHKDCIQHTEACVRAHRSVYQSSPASWLLYFQARTSTAPLPAGAMP